MARRVEPETDWWTLSVSIVLFLGATWFTNKYQSELSELISGQWWLALGSYLLIMIGQVIVAPINPSPLVPVATAVWGPLPAALITLVGWTIGSLVVFSLVRRFGLALVARVLSERRIRQLQGITPTLWAVVTLRLLIPIDLLSYALGFVPGLKLHDYLIGTIIGYAPYALLYAYLGTASFGLQLVIIVVVVSMVLFFSPRWFNKLTRSSEE